MTSIRHNDGAFFAFGAGLEHATLLADLGWRRHPRHPDAWWTRSPYLAAPLAAHAEPEALAAMQPWAWNYETSFAKGPIAGTGVDAIRLPVGRTPYPFQIAGVQRALMREKVIIADEPGCGKQQPVDAKVLTPSGWREMGALRFGDFVYGSGGLAARVVGVYPQGVKPSYRMTFSDHTSVESGPEHLWTVRYRRGGRRWAELVLTTDQIKNRGVIGKLNLAKTTLYLPMLSAPVEFEKVEFIPIRPYVMGQLLANGGMTGSHVMLTINLLDKNEIIDRLNFYGVDLGQHKVHGGSYRIGITGLIQTIRNLGVNVRSGKKFIPQCYKFSSSQDRIDLLQGLMDGDGAISKVGNKVRYTTTSPQLALDVQEIVESLGGIASTTFIDRSRHGKPTEMTVRIRLPKGIWPFSINRKLGRYAPGRSTSPCRVIESVDYTRDVESVCIAVDTPDQLYLTEHCIVTHNTPQSLAVINHLRPARTIIGCPTLLADNWAAECEKWLCDAQPIALLDGAKKTIPEKGIIILPYSRGHSFAKQILAGPPVDYLIMDEFHNTKTPTAKRTLPFLGEGGLARRARRVAALSGTPMPNNPIELYGVLSALGPELVKGVTRERFQELYCQTIDLKVKTARGGQIEVQKIVARGQSVLNAELRASGLMVRRMKNDVLEQLPAKNEYFVHLHPDAEIAELVRQEADLYDQLQMKIMTSQELIALKGHIGHVRAQLGLLKAPGVAAYCKWIFDQGEDRLVLFMLHLPAIEAVRQAFEGSGVKVHVLTGSVNPGERFNRVKDFQAPGGGKKLVIGQVVAAGEGLTMTAARYCVLGEISWTPGKNDQCVDRVHRISQLRQVDAPCLTYPHSADERVIRVNARKAIDARAVLDVNLQNMFLEAAE